MKKLILIVSLSLPLFTMAQKTESKTTSKADTVITKDPSDPEREYWVINNIKGMMKAQGYMLHNKKDGVWREYNEANGVLTKLTEYKAGIQNGAVISLNTSGVLQVDETYLNDKKNGQRTTFGTFGGRMKLLENYKNDILEGTKRTYYDDGKIQEEGDYLHGQRNGKVKWFLQNGNPTMEYTYQNGNLEGPAKVFDEAGRLKQEGFYRDNNEDGEWKEYKDSILVKKIIYKQGQIVKEIPVKK